MTEEHPHRVQLMTVTPEVSKAMLALEQATRSLGLDPTITELVRIRASQLNGCAFCLDMHTIDARAAGETEQRIHVLPAWREAQFYSERERAALALAEAVTMVSDGQVPDDVYAAAAAVFDEKELAALLWVCVVINSWNRLSISTRQQPGHYHAGDH